MERIDVDRLLAAIPEVDDDSPWGSTNVPSRELLEALTREQTPEEKLREAVSYASYRAFAAGVAWGAINGRGEWDDAERAWADWVENDDGAGSGGGF